MFMLWKGRGVFMRSVNGGEGEGGRGGGRRGEGRRGLRRRRTWMAFMMITNLLIN